MKIIRVLQDTPLWDRLASYAQNCAWEGVGEHLAAMMQAHRFTDWEAVFCACEAERIVGFCTFLKTDYYPENRYSPWISTLFVEEPFRGRRISHRLIAAAEEYALKCGFNTVYIPTDRSGFYEKCGYHPIDRLQNYAGDWDTVYARKLSGQKEQA